MYLGFGYILHCSPYSGHFQQKYLEELSIVVLAATFTEITDISENMKSILFLPHTYGPNAKCDTLSCYKGY